MCDSSISAKGLEKFTKTLRDKLSVIDTLDTLESWLNSQPCVLSVITADHLIKTEPPQREVSVTFKMDDGSTVTNVFDVIIFPNQTLGLAGVHGQ